MPITTSSQIEILPLNPKVPEQAGVIDLIRKAFFLSEEEFGYEIKIREALSQIWLRLFQLCAPILQDKTGSANGTDDKIKRMMVHIHEHYSEKISIPELAEVAFLSERECYRAFRNHLHMTPVEYIKIFLDFNAVIVNLDSLSSEKRKQCIDSIEENVKELKSYLEQNIREKENLPEIPATGIAVLKQQFVLAEAIEKWIDSVKEK